MFVELFKNKILPRHYGHEMAISSITDDSRSNTQAITLNLDPLCSLYKKNTTAWVNELVGMRKILEDQAEISEDEILGVRAPGLTPGFNAQYEVDIACHTFSDINFQFYFPNIQVLIDYGFIWDSSQGVPPRATPVWPYTFDYKMPHK